MAEDEQVQSPPEGEAQDESNDEAAAEDKAVEETAAALQEDPITKAKEVTGESKQSVADLKAENDRMEANIKEMKRIVAEDLVGGRSFVAKKKTQEDLDKEEAMKLVAGTGMDPFAEPAPPL